MSLIARTGTNPDTLPMFRCICHTPMPLMSASAVRRRADPSGPGVAISDPVRPISRSELLYG